MIAPYLRAAVAPQKSGATLHVLIWTVVLALPLIVSDSGSGYKVGSIPGLLFTGSGLLHMAIFYGNAFFLYPATYNRHYWWLYVLAGAIAILFSVKLKLYAIGLWFPEMLAEEIVHRFALVPSVLAFLAGMMYRGLNDTLQSERRQKETEAARALAELKYLRSQINPHFLFNVLTNLVSLARRKSGDLEQSLIALADLMRYLFYDGSLRRVTLRKEAELLHHYIALHKLRVENDLTIDYDIRLGDSGGDLMIEPMLLLPFVENVFKHATGPGVSIRLSVTGDCLHFETTNPHNFRPRADELATCGIGLENIKSRLALRYREKYILKTDDCDGVFRVTLKLKLL